MRWLRSALPRSKIAYWSRGARNWWPFFAPRQPCSPKVSASRRRAKLRCRPCGAPEAAVHSARVAVVTGAGRGLGFAIAEGLAREGLAIVVADVDASTLEAACARLRAGGATVHGAQCDVSVPEDVSAMTQSALDAFGRIDVLVNNAGIGPLLPFLEIPFDTWNRVLTVNLSGAFLCGQSVAAVMSRRAHGRIVNIASISGIRAGFGRAAYGTSKAALIQLTRQMAVELAPLGITVNA